MSIFAAGYHAFMNIPYFWIIFIISLVATFLTTIIYKYTTDQKQLKQIKKDLKDLKEKMKKHKTDQKKMLSIQKEMLDKNMIMMKQSFKSMLYTFIPLILIFAWMATTVAYSPIMPNSNVTVTATISDNFPGDLNTIKISSIPTAEFTRNLAYEPGKKVKDRQIQWTMQTKEEGTYTIMIESETFKQSKEIIVTTERKYENPVTLYKQSQLKQVLIGNEKVRPMYGVPLIGGLNWLWTYVLLSVLMSIGLRKLMKVA
ncbi:MAG: EMC3/TMCO1 family protein [Candidatus Nanoarchaeia archaeon]